MIKRVLTSLLLLVVLTLSLHPIITLHFCKGDLQSIAVDSKSEVIACCALSSITENNNLETLSTNLTVSSESCCSFQKVEVITDNFTIEHTNTTIQKSFTFTYLPISAILNYLINLFTPETLNKSNNHISPPWLHSTTLKFLSYICVYRL